MSAGGGMVYVARNARLDDNDAILSVELYEYTVRDTAALAMIPPP